MRWRCRRLTGRERACSTSPITLAGRRRGLPVGNKPRFRLGEDARLHAALSFRSGERKAVVDASGADLTDDIKAMNSADVIARRLLERLPQLKNRHYAVLVTNEAGDEVCRLPLDVVH